LGVGMVHFSAGAEGTDSLKSVGSLSRPAIPGRKHSHRRERCDRHGQSYGPSESPISPTLF
jgi:hypothetical protein